MIKCKSCGKEISKGAKCPECGRDSRSWFAKHKILSVLGALILLGVVGSAFGGDDTTVKESGKKDKKEVIAKVGDTVTVDKKMEYVIENVENVNSIGNDFIKKEAPEGGTFIAVEYSMKNISDEAIGMFSYPQFKLVNDEGKEFEFDVEATATYTTVKGEDDAKVISDLNPDIKVKDYKVFEISKEKYDSQDWFIKVKDQKIKIK